MNLKVQKYQYHMSMTCGSIRIFRMFMRCVAKIKNDTKQITSALLQFSLGEHRLVIFRFTFFMHIVFLLRVFEYANYEFISVYQEHHGKSAVRIHFINGCKMVVKFGIKLSDKFHIKSA